MSTPSHGQSGEIRIGPGVPQPQAYQQATAEYLVKEPVARAMLILLLILTVLNFVMLMYVFYVTLTITSALSRFGG